METKWANKRLSILGVCAYTTDYININLKS